MNNNYRGIKTEKDLDIAILKNMARVSKQESKVAISYMKAREFYTPSRLASEATRHIGEATSNLGLRIGEGIPALLSLLFKKKK